MGGYVALAFWERYPERVAGLVFANTRGDADDEAARERRNGLATRLRSEGNGFLVESPPPLLSPNASGELMTLVKDMIARQPAEAIANAALAMAARKDFMADLANIDTKVLVVSSDSDTLIVPAITQAMEKLTEAQHKAAGNLYQQASAGSGQPGGSGGDAAPGGGAAAGGAPGGDVIDAEVVDEGKN